MASVFMLRAGTTLTGITHMHALAICAKVCVTHNKIIHLSHTEVDHMKRIRSFNEY